MLATLCSRIFLTVEPLLAVKEEKEMVCVYAAPGKKSWLLVQAEME
jgi:hypothetical protein